MLLPTGVIDHRSQQSGGISYSGRQLPADGTQRDIGKHRVYSHARTVFLADGVPISWNSGAIGFGICHRNADDHIGVKKSIYHAAWICANFFLWDAPRDDGRRVAVGSKSCKQDGIQPSCFTIASEIIATGNAPATSTAGWWIAHFAIGSKADSTTPTV